MLAYFFILLGAVLRVVPHPANFAPIAAMALFGGTYLGKKQALIVPIAAMFLSDLFIGFDSWQTRAMVYTVFMLTAAMGMWLKDRKSAWSVVGSSLAASTLFFLVTNLPAVHQNGLYPNTFAGTIESYVNGLPFFRNTLLGDLFYTTAFFGSYELVKFFAKKYAHQGKSAN